MVVYRLQESRLTRLYTRGRGWSF